MTIVTHDVHKSDTANALAAQLKRKNAAGTLTAVDLTGLTVKFKMVNSSGTVVVAETETGVTVTDASNGKVTYDFQSADVTTAGEYYGYFVVYTGAESDTFPVNRRGLKIVVHDD